MRIGALQHEASGLANHLLDKLQNGAQNRVKVGG